MQYLPIIILSILFFILYRSKKITINSKIIFVIFFTLSMTDFFGSFYKLSTANVVFIVPFVFLNFKEKSIFRYYVILFVLFLCFNMISCSYFRNQDISDSITLYLTYFGILYYFLLSSISISVRRLEKILVLLFIIFNICYFVQYIIYPFEIFASSNEYVDEIRLRLSGQALASLGYFYSVNKLLISRQKIFINLTILFSSFVVIFLMGFRTMFIALIVFTIVFALKIKKFSWGLTFKLLFFGFSLFLLVTQTPLSDKIDKMQERQKTETFANSDYVRVLQLYYYTNDHFINNWEYFFGSGLPKLPDNKNNNPGSFYGQKMEGLLDSGLTWVDFGIYSMSWVLGIPAMLMTIIYSIKAYLVKVPKQYKYLGLWFIYLVSVSFTTLEFLRSGNLAIQAFALILIERVVKEENFNIKKLNLNNSN